MTNSESKETCSRSPTSHISPLPNESHPSPAHVELPAMSLGLSEETSKTDHHDPERYCCVAQVLVHAVHAPKSVCAATVELILFQKHVLNTWK